MKSHKIFNWQVKAQSLLKIKIIIENLNIYNFFKFLIIILIFDRFLAFTCLLALFGIQNVLNTLINIDF